ncbi:TPA: EamA family transporter [Candidatus Gastranaerophilales bacterium HUM_10]|nr:MAG TPA: EamA family transporter [Candidatus Gastranaerophilales bacterium HUM_10]
MISFSRKKVLSKRRIIGTINGVIAAASYGTNPLFALPLYSRGMGVNSVLFFRYSIAVILYGVWLVCFKRISLKLAKNEIIPVFLLGLMFSLSSLTLFEAFNYIEAGIACTILFIYPVLVAVMMAIFYKEKLTGIIAAAIGLTSCGILLLYNGKPGTSLNLHGIALVIASAFLYAFYIICVKKNKVIKSIRAPKLSFYVMLFGLIVYIYNLNFCTLLQIPQSPFMWLCVICLSIFPTIISLETITIAIKLIGSTTTAILGALEPLTAIFFGILFFNEHLTLRITLGIILILSGVLLIITKNKQS